MISAMFSEPPSWNDTSPSAERFLVEGYRKMSPAKKLARVFDLSETLRQLSRQRIVDRWGDKLSEREIRFKLAELYLDRALLIAAFGYDPEIEGRSPCP